jgi:hypothetical protein
MKKDGISLLPQAKAILAAAGYKPSTAAAT